MFTVVIGALGALILAGCGDDDGSQLSAADTTVPATTTAVTSTVVASTETATVPPDEPDEPDEAALVMPPEGRPELLSEWHQLAVVGGQLVLAENVVPYSLNSGLFSDYTHKLRTVWLPEGAEPAVYHSDDAFDFPVGTVITKTFYYPLPEGGAAGSDRVLKVATPTESLADPLDLATVRLIETRILVHRSEGWEALPYVWNDDHSEATLQRTGDLVGLTLVDGESETPFSYVVPNTNQCAACHKTNTSTGLMTPIGPKARHLNMDVDLGDGPVSQLAFWQANGLLGETPDAADIPRAGVWDDDSLSIDERARAYLDVNCSHCHNSNGPADTSALFLELSTPLGVHLGVCKPPVAAGTGTGGRLVGIDPGAPEDSIFIYRMQTSDPGAMMPELGRSVPHTEGVGLISMWIETLSGDC